VLDPIANDDIATFVTLRPRLLDAAYRVLRSRADAEDAVQEVWLRWQTTDRAVVRNPRAFLTTATVRLAINMAAAAHRVRELPVGEWTQELPDASHDPVEAVERAAAASQAAGLALGTLTATECAAYVLREGFEYPYRRIAEVLHLGLANTRQLVRRAHTRLATEHRESTDRLEHRRQVGALLAASRHGDLDALERVLVARVNAPSGRRADLPAVR
jgi:RNA polymerase sigma-70 factor (ECF subfamily)